MARFVLRPAHLVSRPMALPGWAGRWAGMQEGWSVTEVHHQPARRSPEGLLPTGRFSMGLKDLDDGLRQLERAHEKLSERARELGDALAAVSQRTGKLEGGLAEIAERTGELEQGLSKLDQRTSDLARLEAELRASVAELRREVEERTAELALRARELADRLERLERLVRPRRFFFQFWRPREVPAADGPAS